MSKIITRLDRIAETYRVAIPKLRSDALNADRSAHGSAANLLATSLRDMAIIDFVKNRDLQAFRAQLLESAEIQLDLFDRFDRGEDVAPSLVSLLAYKALFNALASGSMSVAETLALKMGGRKVDSEECISELDLIFGSVMKYFTLNNKDAMAVWTSRFGSLSWEEKMAGFRGYYEVFQAYLDDNLTGIEAGIDNIIKEHKKIRFFADTTDELLSVWGIGLVNLLRLKGINITVDNALIPAELLI